MNDRVRSTFGSEAPRAHSDGGWKALRDRLRAIISTEVAKLDPSEDARHPLELIVETSVRCAETETGLKITVVDEAGRPRMTDKDGEPVPFTLQDLLEELRRDHPILFKPPDDAGEGMDASLPPEDGRTQRDWLDLDSPRSRDAQASPTQPRLIHLPLNWGKTAFHPGAGSRSASEASNRLNWGRPGAVMSAVALVAALAIGVVALPWEERTSDHQGDPAATGTVTATKTATAPPTPAAPVQRPLRGVPEVLDTATLSLDGEVVRLFGVEWAPGAGKPDDLIRYLQGREVMCEPAGPNDTYRCQVGGQDLSKVVLFNGGGRATPEATAELKAAADKARETKIGVWSN